MKAMIPEERFDRIERQLEFLANHQAQLSASQAELTASQARLSASLETLREISVRHEAEIEAHSTQIAKMADVVVSLAHIVEEQGRRSDERLTALINTVERHISNHRN